MHKTMEKVDKFCEIQQKLLQITQVEMCRDVADINTAELGQVIDMIKDLSEAEKDCYKALYYRTVVEAMEDYEYEESGEESDRMGYDRWRYSSGRYAPKGRGHYSRKGYPMNWSDYYPTFPDEMHPDMDMSTGRKHGYTDPDMDRIMRDEKHGRPYKEWKMSKRHYTETKADGDRKEMSEHAKEHMADTVMTVKEIWMDAEPELRDKMKKDLTALLNEMK